MTRMCPYLLLIVCMGCNHRSENPQYDEHRKEVPFVFIRYASGMPGPNTESRVGIVAAVWRDGMIVRALSEETIGKSYIRGMLSKEQLKNLQGVIEETGIPSTEPGGRFALDAASESLTLRTIDGVLTWGYSPRLYRNEAISRIKAELMTIKPEKVETVEAGPYKSYPHDWYK